MGSIGRASLTLAVLPCCVRRAPSRGLACQSLPTGGFYASPTSLPNSPQGIFGTRRTSAPVFGPSSPSEVPTFGLSFLAPADNRFDLFGHLALESHIVVGISCCVGRSSLIGFVWTFCCGALHWRFASVGSLCLDILGRISTGGIERRRLRVHF